MSAIDAIMGRIFDAGNELELKGGLDFDGFTIELVNNPDGTPKAWRITPNASGGAPVKAAYQVKTNLTSTPVDSSDVVAFSFSHTSRTGTRLILCQVNGAIDSSPDGSGDVTMLVKVDGVPVAQADAQYIVIAASSIDTSSNFGPLALAVLPAVVDAPATISVVLQNSPAGGDADAHPYSWAGQCVALDLDAS